MDYYENRAINNILENRKKAKFVLVLHCIDNRHAEELAKALCDLEILSESSARIDSSIVIATFSSSEDALQAKHQVNELVSEAESCWIKDISDMKEPAALGWLDKKTNFFGLLNREVARISSFERSSPLTRYQKFMEREKSESDMKKKQLDVIKDIHPEYWKSELVNNFVDLAFVSSRAFAEDMVEKCLLAFQEHRQEAFLFGFYGPDIRELCERFATIVPEISKNLSPSEPLIKHPFFSQELKRSLLLINHEDLQQDLFSIVFNDFNEEDKLNFQNPVVPEGYLESKAHQLLSSDYFGDNSFYNLSVFREFESAKSVPLIVINSYLRMRSLYFFKLIKEELTSISENKDEIVKVSPTFWMKLFEKIEDETACVWG